MYSQDLVIRFIGGYRYGLVCKLTYRFGCVCVCVWGGGGDCALSIVLYDPVYRLSVIEMS